MMWSSYVAWVTGLSWGEWSLFCFACWFGSEVINELRWRW